MGDMVKLLNARDDQARQAGSIGLCSWVIKEGQPNLQPAPICVKHAVAAVGELQIEAVVKGLGG